MNKNIIEICQSFLSSATRIDPDRADLIYELLRDKIELSGGRKKRLDIPVAFDIETSSFYDPDSGEKRAITYCWSLCICGISVFGRTWDQYDAFLDKLKRLFEIGPKRRLVIYVHNLNFEFQFMRRRYRWDKVFALDVRRPVYAITDDGIEYRCSYLLSGYSLAVLARNLQHFDLNKKVGDLDYSLIRHAETPMTPEEIEYSIVDTQIVTAYIAEEIERNGSVSKIPLTKTGYVRRYIRSKCLKWPRYASSLMRHLTVTADEYDALRRAFQGGFTHASPFFSRSTVNNVTSYDFTSAYPAVMCSCLFPMSKGEKIEIRGNHKLFDECINNYCCVFDVRFTGLRSKLRIDSPISLSRCWDLPRRENKYGRMVVDYDRIQVNNGRVVKADYIATTITEQDYIIIREFYEWDEIEIGKMYRYRRGYLPKPFIQSVLDLYQKKTELKGVVGREAEYLNSKEMLNSAYGCTVMDIVRDEYPYTDDGWADPAQPDKIEAIHKYNHDQTRFLFYPWGVWVTAYCRKNLFTGILEAGDDYVYSDTDSIKIVNAADHKDYFTAYNEKIRRDLEHVCDHYGLDRSAIEPETKDGKKKLLGAWDDDGFYKRFRSLGAKRYLTEKSSGEYSITVSGLAKNKAVQYLIDKYGDPFKGFDNGLHVPGEYTGKQTHTYIDGEMIGTVRDYLGNDGSYDELSGVHLEPAEYSLSLAGNYLQYLQYLNGGFDIK